jgi:hypothetical protein
VTFPDFTDARGFRQQGSVIDFSPMTLTSGPRKYTIIKDEGGKIHTDEFKRAYKDADAMREGSWDYPKRIRHLTTLAYGSAIEPVYFDLEPRGLVHSFPEDQCPWVHKTFDEETLALRYGRAYVNTEYKCIMDASGTHLFGNIIRAAPPPLYKQDPVLIGLDYNDDWGHAGLVGIQQGSKIYLVDEYRGLALRPPRVVGDRQITDKSGLSLSEWLIGWQERHPGKVAIVGEEQGRSYNAALEALGVRGITPEGWSKAIQNARIPLTIDLCDQGLIVFTDRVPVAFDQARRYHRDEKGNISRQEDHLIDSLHHLIMARSIPGAWSVHDPQKEWV